LQARAENIKAGLEESGIKIAIQESQSTVGGGSLPGETLPTIAISVESTQSFGRSPSFDTESQDEVQDESVDRQAKLFREQPIPIIGRIENDKFVLDLRTVFPQQDEIIISAIRNIFSK
jgi:L-seryl-tRNA(Ser) seleniumtransferase